MRRGEPNKFDALCDGLLNAMALVHTALKDVSTREEKEYLPFNGLTLCEGIGIIILVFLEFRKPRKVSSSTFFISNLCESPPVLACKFCMSFSNPTISSPPTPIFLVFVISVCSLIS